MKEEKVMIIEVIKKIEVNHCNQCPYFHEIEDTSVVFDSFDDPNYDCYCKHKDADNTGTGREEYNIPASGLTYIGTELSRFYKREIPDWCPFKKEQTKKLPSFDESQGTPQPHPFQEIALNG